MNTQQSLSTASHRPLISPFTHNLLWALTAGLVFLAVGFAAPVQAQTETARLAQADASIPRAEKSSTKPSNSFATTSSTWQSNFDEQATHVLQEELSASVHSTMLHDVIAVATQSSNDIDLSTTVGALLDVIKDDANEGQRLMALQALHAISTDHASTARYHRAMTQLHRIVQDESSERVRRAAATTLNDFFESERET